MPIFCVCEQQRLCRDCTFMQALPTFSCWSEINAKILYWVKLCMLNPFKMIESSHSCQLDQSIFILRVAGWYFSVLFKF